jgi:hypothetical protein
MATPVGRYSMVHRLDRDGAVLAGLLLLASALTANAFAQAGSHAWGVSERPFCYPGETPVFAFGFKSLSEVLGDQMGRPLECEHGDPLTGDTMQMTTRGLAVYRVCTNTPAFNRDTEHWALTPDGPVYWAGEQSDPTPSLPIIASPDLRRPCVGARQ